MRENTNYHQTCAHVWVFSLSPKKKHAAIYITFYQQSLNHIFPELFLHWIRVFLHRFPRNIITSFVIIRLIKLYSMMMASMTSISHVYYSNWCRFLDMGYRPRYTLDVLSFSASISKTSQGNKKFMLDIFLNKCEAASPYRQLFRGLLCN